VVAGIVVAVDPDVERVLDSHPGTADLARLAYQAVLRLYPDAVVTTDEKRIAFGSGTGYKGLVLVVTPERRHVKLREVADLERPELRELMRAAMAHNR
jgi:hypothetical protein